MDLHRHNGRTGETIRFAIGLLVAAVVAYFTTTNAIQSQIAAIKATQDSEFGEVLRRLDVMQTDIRELRSIREQREER